MYLRENEEEKKNNFSSITLGLASPELIRKWSSGEVKKAETINYRTYKPEKDGLFCERIFGPTRDLECACGKFKGSRYKGHVCDKCGVEVTFSKVRRERLGHIELAVPIAHVWYVKGTPSKIGNLLNIKVRDLERIIYYESYAVINPGNTGLNKGEVISESEYRDYKKSDPYFEAEMGAIALKKLLEAIDFEEAAAQLRLQLKVEPSAQEKKAILRRLKLIEALRQSGNRPEWMILDVLPVLPPKLRPLVPLEGGRFATSDLNDLYRRVINRNNRLIKLMEMNAPEVILRNEKRMLQEAVDALLDNSKRAKPVISRGNRALKSIADQLKGKQGRFRQNLLGKRVDYSGRSVIVVGPELKLNQCGLPKEMAKELFKPFIIRELKERNIAETNKSAKKIAEREDPVLWEILEDIVKNHPVLLNRAPTLHRLGIQAFDPVLIDEKAIKLHPLVCTAFNADFDGDQMAVHVPLSFTAQLEARMLMLSTNNILSPASGKPIVAPTQDMVLGLYYLTKERSGVLGEGKYFGKAVDVLKAYDNGKIDLHAKIKFLFRGKFIDTTVGRVIFNEIVPEELQFINKMLKKKEMQEIIGYAYRKLPPEKTIKFLDDIKELGFKFSTRGGITFGIDDMIVPENKWEILNKYQKEVDKIIQAYEMGFMSESERYNRVIDIWNKATNQVADEMFKTISNESEGFNSIFMMADSGARGSKDQLKQLAGMRGLMAKPQKKLVGGVGEIIENPIKSNFREGLTAMEYFISTHGSRKGLADTALKTADAGYLTRRLVDVAQDVVITEEDCGTTNGILMTALKEEYKVIEPLHERVLGRVALEDVIDPITGEVIVNEGELITEEHAEIIQETPIEGIRIRSTLTCEAERGLCAKCYGRNLATNKLVDIGEAVGIIAAQSIGEPGTQLTLRTFHIGGAASLFESENIMKARKGGKVEFSNVKFVERKDGKRIAITRNGVIKVHTITEDGRDVIVDYKVPYSAIIKVEDGQMVEKGDQIFEWEAYNITIINHEGGIVEYKDLIDGITLKEEFDEATGRRQVTVVESVEKKHNPTIAIKDENGVKKAEYSIPTGATLFVKNGDNIGPGEVLAKLAREISKTKDITGGLPRVTDLFEARRPKDAAVVTEVDGMVKFGGLSRGNKKIYVIDEYNGQHEYLIPHGKALRVHDGDFVKAGEKLCEGPVDPHDILRIQGEFAVATYLLNEIQEVYRIQGEKINDKHIAIIVRQMLRKVQIIDPGDTLFLEGQKVDKVKCLKENERIMKKGGTPAKFQPILLGITKAALNTDSFISAASFQETARVLTDAAIYGKKDELVGLKENIIMGHLIPAGTGMHKYRKIRLVTKEELEKEKTKNQDDKENIGKESYENYG